MALRLLHFSDAHIGVESYGRIDPKTGMNTRLLDFTRALDGIVERATAGDVHLVVFTGDAYRSRDPNPTHQREFARRIHKISAAGVQVYLLVGNHDLPNAQGRANSVDIFETLAIPNVKVGRLPDTTRIETKAGTVQIAGIPWVNQSILLSREELRTMTNEEIRVSLGDRIANQIGNLVEKRDPNLLPILAAHVSVVGSTYGSERSVTLGGDVLIAKHVIANPAFDYVALGHLHKRQRVSEYPLAYYAGSLERVDFGEEHDQKGYLIVDIEGKGKATAIEENLDSRRFLTIKVDARETDPTEEALRQIEAAQADDAIVRLEIATTPDLEPKIDFRAIRNALRGAYHVAGISKKIDEYNRSRIPDITGMSPLEALKAYLKSKETPADRTKALVERGEAIINFEQSITLAQSGQIGGEA